MTTKEGDVARGPEAREQLDIDLRDAKLKSDMMENWKKRVTGADQKAAAALLEVAEAKSELRKVAENGTRWRGC